MRPSTTSGREQALSIGGRKERRKGLDLGPPLSFVSPLICLAQAAWGGSHLILGTIPNHSACPSKLQ